MEQQQNNKVLEMRIILIGHIQLDHDLDKGSTHIDHLELFLSSYFITSLSCFAPSAGASFPRCFALCFSECSGICKPGLCSAVDSQIISDKSDFLNPTETLLVIFQHAPLILYPCDVSFSCFYCLHLLHLLSPLSSLASFQKGLSTSSACGGKIRTSPD